MALHQYLSWHGAVPAPRTVRTGVRKIAPATVRVVERDGTHRDHCYWQPSYTRNSAPGEDPALWQEALHDALRTAVQRRTVADVPVGVLCRAAWTPASSWP